MDDVLSMVRSGIGRCCCCKTTLLLLLLVSAVAAANAAGLWAWPACQPADLPCLARSPIPNSPSHNMPQVLGRQCHNLQMPMLPAALIDLASWVCPF